jgi:hypothetical protein
VEGGGELDAPLGFGLVHPEHGERHGKDQKAAARTL